MSFCLYNVYMENISRCVYFSVLMNYFFKGRYCVGAAWFGGRFELPYFFLHYIAVNSANAW